MTLNFKKPLADNAQIRVASRFENAADRSRSWWMIPSGRSGWKSDLESVSRPTWNDISHDTTMSIDLHLPIANRTRHGASRLLATPRLQTVAQLREAMKLQRDDTSSRANRVVSRWLTYRANCYMADSGMFSLSRWKPFIVQSFIVREKKMLACLSRRSAFARWNALMKALRKRRDSTARIGATLTRSLRAPRFAPTHTHTHTHTHTYASVYTSDFLTLLPRFFLARPGPSCGETVVLRDASRVITRGNATPQFRAAANWRANAQITSAIAADFEAHANNGNGYTANRETRTRCKEPWRQA